MKEIIEQTLHNLSVTRNYRGYRCVLIAVELVLKDEDCMVNMGLNIYAPTAAILHCNQHSIERNIRTVINRVWSNNKNRLCSIAGFDLKVQPTVSEFLDIIATHVMRTSRLSVR